jgi:hypothetical protein
MPMIRSATPTFLRLPTAASPQETSELDIDPFNESIDHFELFGL